MKELAERFIQKVDQLPILRAHHGHELGLLQDAVAAVLGKDVLAARPRLVPPAPAAATRPPIASGTSTPASSRIVGPMSIIWQSPSIRRPPSKRPGDQTISGTRVMMSYIVHFWLWPWSPSAVAVIGGEDDDRVVQIAFRLQRLQDLADLLVDHRHVGQIVGPLAMALLARRFELMDDRVVVDLACCAGASPGRAVAGPPTPPSVTLAQRQVLLQVGLGVARDRVVGRVGPGKADLQKERLLGLGLGLEPPAWPYRPRTCPSAVSSGSSHSNAPSRSR